MNSRTALLGLAILIALAAAALAVVPNDREFRDQRYHVSLRYPAQMKTSVFDEGGGAVTMTFDKEHAEAFQIFIVPYDGNKMFDDRFTIDVPSGVRIDATNVTVDGVSGTAFYSTDPELGETREVWFVHDGLLYEVVTFRQLDTWLSDILQTWKFI